MSKQTKRKDYVLILRSEPKQVIRVERFLERLNKRIHLDEARYNKLLIATTEAVNNSIIHGNKRNPEKEVMVVCHVNAEMLIVRVQDEGSGIDPERLPDPLSEENLLRENGRGVFLMRSMMDEVEFERSPGHSAVVMKMKIV